MWEGGRGCERKGCSVGEKLHCKRVKLISVKNRFFKYIRPNYISAEVSFCFQVESMQCR